MEGYITNFWSQLKPKWPSRLTKLIQHRNGCNLVKFTDGELKPDVIVANHHSQHILKALMFLAIMYDSLDFHS